LAASPPPRRSAPDVLPGRPVNGASARARAQARLAATPSPLLVESLLALDAKADDLAEERTVAVWIVDELERRHPEVVPALEVWVDTENPEDHRSYAQVLIDALPASARPTPAQPTTSPKDAR
jgi:hypothetical protein